MDPPAGKRSGADGSICKICWKGLDWQLNSHSTIKVVGTSQPHASSTPAPTDTKTWREGKSVHRTSLGAGQRKRPHPTPHPPRPYGYEASSRLRRATTRVHPTTS